MINSYFNNFFFLNLLNIWLYFSIHISLFFFFSLHFFFIKFFKYKIDFKNISLKNLKNFELIRTMSNTIKTILLYDKQFFYRYVLYIKILI